MLKISVYSREYIRKYWSDLYQIILSIGRYIYVGIIKLIFVLRSPKVRCYGNQLILFFADVEINRLHSLLWRFKMNCNTAMRMRALTAAIIPLHRVNLVNSVQ